MLCGAVGIALNIFLFIGKWLAGILSGSIAITADAFNNLSDAGSSVITLAGLQALRTKPDTEHPFGHGRMEYISGLLVSVAILIMGFELIRSSIDKIRTPEPIECSPVIIAVLIASILVKIYMYYYNRTIGHKIDSTAMQATAGDSLSDTVSIQSGSSSNYHQSAYRIGAGRMVRCPGGHFYLLYRNHYNEGYH